MSGNDLQDLKSNKTKSGESKFPLLELPIDLVTKTGLYLNENDTAAAYSVKVDINNVEQTNDFAYEVSSTTVDEGETATFTITRDGSGEVSTVWIATSNETADTSDYAELALTSLTFFAKETTKTDQEAKIPSSRRKIGEFNGNVHSVQLKRKKVSHNFAASKKPKIGREKRGCYWSRKIDVY